MNFEAVERILNEARDKLDHLIPPGREWSLVQKKLDEAKLWAYEALEKCE